jgi:transcriptional antiterminator NusG
MSDINQMNVGPRWYVAHTYSGYENKVKDNLEKIVENRALGHLIFDIRIPVEKVIEKNGDVEKEVEYKIFPSYVYIKMCMTDESWHAVRNITGVTGFVGPGSRPRP